MQWLTGLTMVQKFVCYNLLHKLNLSYKRISNLLKKFKIKKKKTAKEWPQS